MKADLYIDILGSALLPFICEVYPDGHKLCRTTIQSIVLVLLDNGLTMDRQWIADNWWRTPAESPDMNPIENMWHELKEYIR